MRKAGPDEQRVSFKARLSGGVETLFKSDDGDRFVIWGKASVEVVDKEGDKITGKALQDALPQLLRRSRLSVEHTDQLVGDILESFETDEPTTVEIDGKEYTRTEFPTGVLKIDGEEPTLFVAGEVWNDTQQARESREKIEEGEYDSYSISGEAITSSTQVKNGDVYDKISELDLSAVTLCEEGMNQKAKFGTVVKMGSDDPNPASSSATVAKSDTDHVSMTDPNDPDEGQEPDSDLRKQFKEAAQEALDESDFATKEDVEEIVDEKVDEAVDERLENEDAAMTSDEGGEATYGGGEDEEEEAEKTEEKSEVELKAEEMAEKYGVDAEKARELLENEFGEDEDDEEVPEADPDEIEDPDDDGTEEVDIDPTEDEEDDEPMPDEEEAEKGGIIEQLEAEGVPDDLCEAVEGYVDGEGEEPGEPEEPMEPDEGDDIELEDEDGTTEKEAEEADAVGGEDLGEGLSKMDDDEYLTTTAGSSLPDLDEDEEIGKSYEVEVEKESGDENEGTLDALYDSIPDAEAP